MNIHCNIYMVLSLFFLAYLLIKIQYVDTAKTGFLNFLLRCAPFLDFFYQRASIQYCNTFFLKLGIQLGCVLCNTYPHICDVQSQVVKVNIQILSLIAPGKPS